MNEDQEKAIAGDLLTWVKEEEEKTESLPLRHLYLGYLRLHFVNVQDGSADLEDYQRARKDIENQLATLEEEYGAKIQQAIEDQED